MFGQQPCHLNKDLQQCKKCPMDAGKKNLSKYFLTVKLAFLWIHCLFASRTITDNVYHIKFFHIDLK